MRRPSSLNFIDLFVVLLVAPTLFAHGDEGKTEEEYGVKKKDEYDAKPPGWAGSPTNKGKKNSSR